MEYLVLFTHTAGVHWMLHVPGMAEKGQVMTVSWPESLPVCEGPAT